MTVTSGPIAPLPAAVSMPYSLVNEQRIASGGQVVPINISRDRSTIFGVARLNTGNPTGTGLYSINDLTGATSLIYNFTDKPIALVETYDGEALCICLNGTSAGRIWRSSSWSTNKATATWTPIITLPGGMPYPEYSANRWSMGTNGVMVISEQGGQTVPTTATGDNTADNATAVTNNATKAHKAYVTVDNGQTWATLYDQLTQSPLLEPRLISGTHIHGAQYDEAWDRMWITFGDGSGQGPNLYGTSKLQVIYSDDWRNVTTGGTATWNTLPLLADYPSTDKTYALQFVSMLITSKNIMMQPDGIPFAPLIFPRTGYRTLGTPRFGPMMPITFTNNSNIIGKDLNWAGKGFPIFASFYTGNGSSTSYHNHMYCSADEGGNWYEIWKDSVRTKHGGDTVKGFGPTLNGKVVGYTYDTANGAALNGSVILWDLVKNS